jgi:hypothetical protein
MPTFPIPSVDRRSLLDFLLHAHGCIGLRHAFFDRTRVSVLLVAIVTQLEAAGSDWPQFRGPNGSGVAAVGRPPVQFGPSNNLSWKVSVPPGLSAPIVWGDRIFLTGVVSNQLFTLAYDRNDGRELWRRMAPARQLESCHEFSSPAASTPCTDGQRVYSYFGSFGLLSYDFNGNEVWKRAFDRLPIQYGTASSPILAGDRLILQRDADSTNAQVIALAPASGETLWEAPRPLAGASYSTPMVWHREGSDELIVQGKGQVMAYDPASGEQKWWVRGWSFTAVTTPVEGGGLLFAGGSGLGDPAEPVDPILNWDDLIARYDTNKDGKLEIEEIPADLSWWRRREIPREVPGNSLNMRWLLGTYADRNKDKVITKEEWEGLIAFSKDKFNADRLVAIRPGGKGDATVSRVAWETTRGLSEIPSPLFYQGRVHFIRDGALWTVADPETGHRVLDRERIGIGGQMVASPIAANGFIYLVNEAGTFAVLRAGDKLDVAGINKLGEHVRVTPAIAGDCLYVRSLGHLWAFRSSVTAP